MKFEDRANLFIRRARDLEKRRLWTNPNFHTTTDMPAIHEIKPDFSNVWISVLPDEEEALALLVTFTVFILLNEPLQLGIFYRDAVRAISCSRSQVLLTESRRRWERHRDEWPITFTINGRSFKAHQALDLWMYGYVFHNNEDKVDLLEDIPKGLLDAMKVQALHYVLSTTHEILRVCRILERAKRKRIIVDF